MPDVTLNHLNPQDEVTGLTEGATYGIFSMKPGGLVLVEAETPAGYEEVLKRHFLNDVILVLPGTKLRFTLSGAGANVVPASIRVTAKA